MAMPAHPRYADHHFLAEVVGYAVQFYLRTHPSLRMVDELQRVCSVPASNEDVRQ